MRIAVGFLMVISFLNSFAEGGEWKKWMQSYLACSNCSFDMQFKMYEKKNPSAVDVESGKFIRIDSTKEYYKIGPLTIVQNFPKYIEVDDESREIYYQEKLRQTGSIQQLFSKFSDSIYHNVSVKQHQVFKNGDIVYRLIAQDSSFKSVELTFSEDHALKSIKIEMNDVADQFMDENDQPYILVQSPVWEIHYSNLKLNISPDANLFNINNYVRQSGARTLGVKGYIDYTVHQVD